MALAVPVVLPVGFVVLLVVGHQVVQGEAVVAGDEVDGGAGPPAGVFVEVRRAGQPGGELAQGGGLAAPVVADGVAVLAVPLRPQPREVADLVAALADVPGLGDQLDLADDRILLDQVEERRQPVDVVELAGQRRGQVEAEAVHVHLQHPVAQRVHDQLQGVGIAGVEAVAGAGEVLVQAQVAVEQAVVGGVVDTAEVDRRPQVVAFGGVVVDDVEDHLDAGLVERAHHRLELRDRGPGMVGGGVLVVRREEAEGVVAPVVSQPEIEQPVVVHELVDRHQFDGGDVERLQMIDDRRVPEAGIGATQFLGDPRMSLGHALDVRLVDDRLVVRGARRMVGAPVEERVDHHAGHGVARRIHHRRCATGSQVLGIEVVGVQRLAEVEVTVERLAVRVEQQLARVAAMPGRWDPMGRTPGTRSAVPG